MSVWVYVCSVVACIYFGSRVLRSGLTLDRESHWFASDLVKEHCVSLPAIMPVRNHDRHCQERGNAHRRSLLYVRMAFDYVNAAVLFSNFTGTTRA